MTIMQELKTQVHKLVADEKGLAAVEYGLLAAGIAVALWAVVGDVGTSLGTIFTSVKTDLAAPHTTP